MSESLQIFIFATDKFTRDNNSPVCYFNSIIEKHLFILSLVSKPREEFHENYFVINNPQLLPREIREKHMYQGLDACFSLYDNLHAFTSCYNIYNNTRKLGFTDICQKTPWIFSSIQKYNSIHKLTIDISYRTLDDMDIPYKNTHFDNRAVVVRKYSI